MVAASGGDCLERVLGLSSQVGAFHLDHVGGLEGVVVHRCHGREGIGRRRAYHAAVKF